VNNPPAHPSGLTDVCEHHLVPFANRTDGSGTNIRYCYLCAIEREPAIAQDDAIVLPKLIAFTGTAQSGKTTCAKYLADKFRYGTLSFAAPLKKMLAAITSIDDKEATPPVLCGKTVRHAMQTLGTEWGRNLIGPDVWIRAAERECQRILSTGVRGVTIDDARFDNEARLVHELGGLVIELDRPGSARMAHVSERGINPDLIHATISAEDPVSLVLQLEEYLSRS
jgi:hypothetical protein